MARSITCLEDRACQDGVFVFTCLGRRFEITGPLAPNYGTMTQAEKDAYNLAYDEKINALISAIPCEPYAIIGSDPVNRGVIIKVRDRELCVRLDAATPPTDANWRVALQDAADELAANQTVSAVTEAGDIPATLLP